MSGAINAVGASKVQGLGPNGAAPTAGAAAPPSVLPAPQMEVGAANGDVMSMLYVLTAKQRDAQSTQGAAKAERKGSERQEAFDHMRDELQKAKEAKEDGSWLSKVTAVLDSAADATVGGNPFQDVSHTLSESTGCAAFDVAYDFIRPDALLHGAVLLTKATTGRDEVAQVYDGVASTSSLKTRSQGAADVSGQEKVMTAYEITRDAIAAAMVAVSTCGTGTVALVALSASAALMMEAKLDLLGQAGVGGKEKMWIRLGAQAVLIVGGAGAGLSSSAGAAKSTEKAFKSVSNVISGANQAARGAVKVGEAIYQHAADDHLTEAAKHENTQHQANREQDRIISGLREVSKSYQRTLENIASTINERDQTPLMLARQIA